MKDVAGKCNPRNTLSFFCCDILLTIFSSGNVDEAPTTGRSKQTNFLQQKRLKVFLGLHFVYLEPDLRLPIVLNFNSAGKSILML